MSEREVIARLYRRAGFGLAPGQLDELTALGVDSVIERLVDPGGHGIPAEPDDLWADVTFPFYDTVNGSITAVNRWLDHLVTAGRSLEEWMAWYWHGHLVSGLAVVAFPPKMTAQINLFRRGGLGPFPDLLRATTIDPAMLSYLDGVDSTGRHPNENYSRELLELFALGVGNFTEDDVLAGARALTGWRVRFDDTGSAVDPVRASSYLDPAGHDGTPQRYLGRAGVHDLDTVIEAVVAHEACAGFVAARFGRAVLGPDAEPELLDRLADRFRDADLDLRTLARGLLEAVAEGRTSDLVLGPLPWLVAAQRATGAVLGGEDRYWGLHDSGHLPMWPPNVGGWPGGTTWLASSTTAQRYNLAGAVAVATAEDNPARAAAAAGDLDELADALGRPEGFTAATRDALGALVPATGQDGGVGLLTVALASPDLVMA